MNKRSIVFLIVIIIVSSLASNVMSILVDPWPFVRTLVMAVTLAVCFYLVQYSKIKIVSPLFIAFLVAIFAFLLEVIIPVADYGRSEIFVSGDADYMYLAGCIRVAGYLVVFFVAALCSWWISKRFQNRTEKKTKLLTALPYLIIGPLGGIIFSAVNQLELAIVTAFSGLLFSFPLYLGFFSIILFNKIPVNEEELIETDS